MSDRSSLFQFRRLPERDPGACKTCNGSGIHPYATWACPTCRGTGEEKTA